MTRNMMKSKIHRAVVIDATLEPDDFVPQIVVVDEADGPARRLKRSARRSRAENERSARRSRVETG